MPDTLQRVLAVVEKELEIMACDIDLDGVFGESIKVDSLGLIEIVMGLEREFGIEIPDVDAEQLTTVRKIVDYIDTYNKADMEARKTKDIIDRWG